VIADIRTPKHYVNEPNALQKVGEYVKQYGPTAFILGGETALQVASKELLRSLDESSVTYYVEEFKGFPTVEFAEKLANTVRGVGASTLIAVGGGRVTDTAKQAGYIAELPVVAVPTIAATCAPFAACTILYNNEGTLIGFDLPDNSPIAVFADTQIIAQAPLRYLRAGIADTIAKWYEFSSTTNSTSRLIQRLQANDGKLALDIIEEQASSLIGKLNNAHPQTAKVVGATQEFIELVDAIFLLAGLVGSITSGAFYTGFAHPFYNSITQIPETRDKLHGEKVSYGLLAQSLLEKKDDAYVERLINTLLLLEQPLTLAQLGIIEDVQEKVEIVIEGVFGSSYDYSNNGPYPLTREQAFKAVLDADALGQKVLRERGLEHYFEQEGIVI
jgi:glycerol dehydrogenase